MPRRMAVIDSTRDFTRRIVATNEKMYGVRPNTQER
jgi:hypothetical protein